MNRTLPSVLDRSRALVASPLREAVARLAPRLRGPVEYHFGWVDELGRPTESDGGKNLRATLALLSATAVGAEAAVAIPGAVAIELVHNFSLIHDDVIDDDRERRHRPTLWTTYGVGAAIVVGDALVTLAVETLLEQPGRAGARATRALLQATAGMIAGQADDIAFEGEAEVSLDDCVAMARAKTGAILACASSIGAILADASDAEVGALTDYGMHLGLAFQMVDDVLGIWGEPEITGKPVWSDLRQHKKTIPIVAALERSTTAELPNALDAAGTSHAAAQRAANLIEDLGGRSTTEEIARAELTAALDALATVRLDPVAVGELEALAHFVVGRER